MSCSAAALVRTTAGKAFRAATTAGATVALRRQTRQLAQDILAFARPLLPRPSQLREQGVKYTYT